MRHESDLHSHTLASGHAYNTITEMVEGARQAGLKLYGITEHGPRMPGTCHVLYFANLKALTGLCFRCRYCSVQKQIS